MRIAFDTNVLVYASGVDRHPNDTAKIGISQDLIARLRRRAAIFVPVQVLGELFTVLVRSGHSRETARDLVLRTSQSIELVPSTSTAFIAALDLAINHKLQLWDAIILNAAAEIGCSLLLSEDMANGFVWRGTTIVNPFAEEANERLSDLLA